MARTAINSYEPAEDSYLLAKTLKDYVKNKDVKKLTFLEVGCSTGFQLDELIRTGVQKKNVFGVDIDREGLIVAKKKGLPVAYSDMFQNVTKKFDIIFTNPPYLPLDKLEPKSSRRATTGGKDGGEWLNHFLRDAQRYVNPNGQIIVLVSSLTKGIIWRGYKKRLLAKEKLFFEELKVYLLTPQ